MSDMVETKSRYLNMILQNFKRINPKVKTSKEKRKRV